jgi:hypothetical protein
MKNIRARRRGWCFFCCSLLVCLIGCEQRTGDPVPPFKVGDESVDGVNFHQLYTEDEERADRAWKGKVIEVEISGDPSQPLVDASGDRYVIGWTVRDEKAPGGKREVVRCYMYRPDNPIVEEPKGGMVVWSAIGVCKGKINGIVVLRNCSFRVLNAEGPDW